MNHVLSVSVEDGEAIKKFTFHHLNGNVSTFQCSRTPNYFRNFNVTAEIDVAVCVHNFIIV